MKRLILLGCIICLLAAGCDTLLASLSQPDATSATQTALATQPASAPTLDLKGNHVIESETCSAPYEVICVSILEDHPNGGIMKWSDNAPLFAYVAPSNRYWAWFSGDGVVLDFSNDADSDHPDGTMIPPTEYSTANLHVFGNFSFSQDNKHLAFVSLRQSEKLYTVHVASFDSGLSDSMDLFPDTLAESDEYSSEKSVIGWEDNDHVNVATSCGIDCEQLYTADINNGALVKGEEVRKKGHTGREHSPHVIKYDTRYYPAMNYSNWSADESRYIYTDNRNQVWIVKEDSKEQYQLDIPGTGILETAWSFDHKYLAVRYDDSIMIINTECK